jgi:hypothetical protein
MSAFPISPRLVKGGIVTMDLAAGTSPFLGVQKKS